MPLWECKENGHRRNSHLLIHSLRSPLGFSSLPLTAQLQQFKEDNLHVGFGSGTLALEQALEKTMANIKWVAENKEQVLQWLTAESA